MKCSSSCMCVNFRISECRISLWCVIEMRCLWLGWGLWSRVLIGAACVHWLLCWAVVLVGGGFEEQLCNCLSIVGRSFSLSSLGFWLRWWLALQTCFMWSCTMWTAGAWTWGGGSLWSRMADTSCVGIVSLWAPLCFNDAFSPSFYLPHFFAIWAGDFLSSLTLPPSSPHIQDTHSATCISDLSHDHPQLDQKATDQVFNSGLVMCCTPSPPLSLSLPFSLSSLSSISEYG